jgi:hypothetical protein
MSIRRGMLFTLGAKIKNLVDAFKARVLNTQGEFEAESCLNTQLTQLDNQNLLDNASLVVTPNGYRETLLYAVEPNEVGTNLLQQSEGFTQSVWILLGSPNVTRTANAGTSPTGTNNATLLTSNSTSSFGIRQLAAISPNTQYVFSCWVRSNTPTEIRVDISDLNNTLFNLTNTWQRIQVLGTYNNSYAANSQFVDIVFGPNQLGSSFFIWGAQLVPGSTITDYISTTDRAIINGTIGDMSVTRATTATRVNSDGFIEQVPYNLFQRSEEFENTALWNRQNILSISTNVANSPIGTLTADKIIPDTTLNQHRIFQQFNFSGQGVLSVYAKADGYNFLSLARDGGVAGSSIIFNLSNGTISGTASGFTPSIESVGNGWYRCSIYRADLGAGINLSYWIIARESATTANYTGDGISGILVWGAQLVQGTQPKDYFPTTNRQNVPRIDYSNGSCPSILVEPQRTNLLIRSEEFEDASWVKDNSSILTNTAISPSNVLNADTYIGNGLNLQHFIYQNLSVTSGITYSISIYAKKDTNNFIQLCGSNAAFGVNCFANFDISNGTIGTIGSATIASIDSVGNGWYRLKITSTAIATTSVAPILISLITSSTSIKTETNNLSTSVYLWGAQLEAGPNVTSYIPTVASTVTRNADVITNTNASTLIGQTEGTIYVDANLQGQSFSDNVSKILCEINLNNTSQNRITLYRFNNLLYYDNVVNNVVQSSGTPFFTITNFTGKIKIALVYQQNNFKVFLNGALINTDTSALIPICNNINIGHARNSVSWNGTINNTILYKTTLTDAQAIQLTTV